MPATLASLVAALRQLPLLTAAQLKTVVAVPHPSDAAALLRDLVQRGWLTAYQANRLAQERGAELLLASYVILDKLGQGGMGQVFLARDPGMDRRVAIKVLRGDTPAGPDTVSRFQREIKAVAKLSHPNIILAHHAGQVDGQPYFVMEYVEGVDLAKLVKQRGPLPPAEACDYARQAALGLQHIHEHGLVHRDLKPHNLLLAGGADTPAARRVVKILDLGLARLAATPLDHDTGLTGAGVVMGTADYIAPEQARDAANVDIRADLYSLGCTLYHLLTGQPPFAGGSFATKLDGHLHGTPPAPQSLRPELSAALSAVVLRLMAKRPADRYQTPAEAAAALAAFCGQPVGFASAGHSSKTAESTLTHFQPPARPAAPRWWIAAVGTGTLALLILVVVLVVANNTTSEGNGNGKQQAEGKKQPEDKKPSEDKKQAEGKDKGAEKKDQEKKAVVVPEPDGKVGLIRSYALEGPVRISQVNFSRDGKRILGGGVVGKPAEGSARVLIWDAGSDQLLDRLQRSAIDYNRFPCAWDENRLLFQHDLGQLRGKPLQQAAEGPYHLFIGHGPTPLNRIVFSATGKLALSIDGGYNVLVWDVQDWEGPIREKAPAPREPLVRASGLCASLSHDDRRLLSVIHYNNKLQVWDVPGKKKLQELAGPPGDIRCVALSPDYRWAAIASTDTSLRLWDLEAQKQKCFLSGHGGKVLAVAFSPDGHRLLTGSEDGTMRLWDVAKGEELEKFEGHKGTVLAVAFSPDGRRALSGGSDASVKLWQLPK